MNYQQLADNMLWKLVRVSDDKALAEIYRRHWKPLLLAAYYRLRSKEVAQELVQNLFVRLWEKRETLVIEQVEAYLQRAMKNSVLNYVQAKVVEEKYRAAVQGQSVGQATGSDTTLLLQELNEAIEHALRQLPDKTREIFHLSRFENHSTQEIARRMNLTEKAVEYHITKSLKLLRIQLKDFIFLLALSLGFI